MQIAVLIKVFEPRVFQSGWTNYVWLTLRKILKNKAAIVELLRGSVTRGRCLRTLSPRLRSAA